MASVFKPLMSNPDEIVMPTILLPRQVFQSIIDGVYTITLDIKIYNHLEEGKSYSFGSLTEETVHLYLLYKKVKKYLSGLRELQITLADSKPSIEQSEADYITKSSAYIELLENAILSIADRIKKRRRIREK